MTLLLTVFSGGLFLIDVVILGLAAFLLYQAYKASQSGSWHYKNSNTPKAKYEGSDVDVPIQKTPQFWMALALIFLIEPLSLYWRYTEL